MTWRLLGVLVDGLPGESAVKTAIRETIPDEELADLARQRTGHGAWSHTDLILAAIADRLDWIHTAVYRSRGARINYPDPWPRPGVVARRRRLSAAGAAYLQRLRDEHARLHGD